MKININFTIEYDEPKNKNEYKKLLKVIKTFFEEDICIPQTEKLPWKTIGTVCINVYRNGNKYIIQ